ncbi:MAG: hypothetical protein DA408_10700 [Bacteroidetes bacterium]|nr:MAG: hypothetical protein C7N36_07895 [Bacteroidota bacterium]PTM12423.1 MAG: hypothetical protein DA408_10700 [Bacteroidota bacterium]
MVTPAYSIVVPVYNTEVFTHELLRRITATMEALGQSYEIICIDDGSPDGAWNQLTALYNKGTYPLKLIQLTENYGQHKALLCGLKFATATQAVILIDADLQTPPEEIAKLIHAYQTTGTQVIYGTPKNKQQPFLRHWGSRFLGKILLRQKAISPYASSFKLLDVQVVHQLQQAGFEYVFLDAMISWFTHDIGVVEVERASRSAGKSGYSLTSLFAMTVQIIIHYTALPLKVMTLGGLLSAVVCFVAGLVFVIRKLVYDVPLGFTATIVIISFGLSLILASLGIIGEYMRRLYFLQLRKPQFAVKAVKL